MRYSPPLSPVSATRDAICSSFFCIFLFFAGILRNITCAYSVAAASYTVVSYVHSLRCWFYRPRTVREFFNSVESCFSFPLVYFVVCALNVRTEEGKNRRFLVSPGLARCLAWPCLDLAYSFAIQFTYVHPPLVDANWIEKDLCCCTIGQYHVAFVLFGSSSFEELYTISSTISSTSPGNRLREIMHTSAG